VRLRPRARRTIRVVGSGDSVLPAILPALQSRAAARLGTVDRAIFAMRLAGTSMADMAAVAGLGTAELRVRSTAIVTGLGEPAIGSVAARPRRTAA
jgi:hypothetical protein